MDPPTVAMMAPSATAEPKRNVRSCALMFFWTFPSRDRASSRTGACAGAFSDAHPVVACSTSLFFSARCARETASRSCASVETSTRSPSSSSYSSTSLFAFPSSMPSCAAAAARSDARDSAEWCSRCICPALVLSLNRNSFAEASLVWQLLWRLWHEPSSCLAPLPSVDLVAEGADSLRGPLEGGPYGATSTIDSAEPQKSLQHSVESAAAGALSCESAASTSARTSRTPVGSRAVLSTGTWR
mmetsp:Transcript_35410/g.74338  ORF Transcript_35410/g.74338 Transcript_35410/m.74338 type:complete len:243 (-) Transcript_35410:1078-1806(-)